MKSGIRRPRRPVQFMNLLHLRGVGGPSSGSPTIALLSAVAVLSVLFIFPACAARPPGRAVRLAAVSPAAEPSESAGKSSVKEKPRAFREKGRLVCLAEEMKRAHGASVQPVHEHLLGFRLERKVEPGSLRFYTLLRTSHSEALFVDERFRERTLILFGRVFPRTATLEISKWQWIRDGKVHEVYYWCEVCSIRGIDPGPCSCCQGKVVLQERPESPVKPR